MTDTDAPQIETAAAPPEGPGLDLLGDPIPSEDEGYRVLARKYRPQNFAELVGQDALVRTLTNAINTGRIAHAFMLTGVRGIGKTTTARIIAKALNCLGPDGTRTGPDEATPEPCGVCANCVAIAEDRHVDVMEMDAASHTGVDNIRDIIDGVQYKPIQARFKVYIIDEVHMLSKPAFNALLKTLEEPPEHVKFIFATTEIGKVPITVLSRCQRFDLRRLDGDLLAGHLTRVAEKERASLEPAAIGLLARAADGSVRDGLSLLDQVIAQASGGRDESGDEGGDSAAGGTVTAEQVRDLLGLADRAQILDLFDLLMQGDAAPALALAEDLYRAGADPAVMSQELLEVAHWLTRLKITPDTAASTGMSDTEKNRAQAMAGRLSIPVLTRAWQILLKGHGEILQAGRAMTALEMLLVRLCYVADMPPPGDLVKALEGAGAGSAEGAGSAASPAAAGGSAASAIGSSGPGSSAVGASAASGGAAGGVRAMAGGLSAAQAIASVPAPETAPRAETAPAPAEPAAASPQRFADAVELFAAQREALLHAHLVNDVHLVTFEPGRIEIRPEPTAPPNLANRVGALLTEWTGARWVVSVSAEPGEATLREQADAREAAVRAEAEQNPLVQAVLKTFPGAEITAVRDLAAEAAAAAADDSGVTADPDADSDNDEPDAAAGDDPGGA